MKALESWSSGQDVGLDVADVKEGVYYNFMFQF